MKVDTGLLVRYVIRETLGIVVMAVALFWSAGRIDWWAAWAVLAVMAGWIIATAVVILRYNPDLLAERLGPRQGAKRWDVAIMSVVGLSQLARYVIAGLDQRYGWTGGFPVAAQVVAFILCGLGYVLVVWATAVNAFFSQIVRVQTERGQSVVMDGPYHYVRHPAYAGAILFELAVPVLLASWWAFIPSLLNAVLLTVRTVKEDRLLQRELTGYSDYAHQIHARLLPGIW